MTKAIWYVATNAFTGDDEAAEGSGKPAEFHLKIKFKGVKSGSHEELVTLQTLLGTGFRVERVHNL